MSAQAQHLNLTSYLIEERRIKGVRELEKGDIMPSSLVADLDSYNKENQQRCSVNKVAPTKRSSKFSDLLSNAAGDIQKGEDLQVAHSIQRAEFQSISNEWVQEIVGAWDHDL